MLGMQPLQPIRPGIDVLKVHFRLAGDLCGCLLNLVGQDPRRSCASIFCRRRLHAILVIDVGDLQKAIELALNK